VPTNRKIREKDVHFCGYHVPKAAADQFVRQSGNTHFRALPHEDARGVEPATNNYGVWESWEFYWVLIVVKVED
jgi:hypothetical protein